MRPRNLQHLDISQVFNLITRADRAKISENQFIEVSGVFNTLEAIVAQRDFGSKNLYENYPTGRDLVSGFLLFDAVDREYHPIILVKDSLGDLEIWVHDEYWIEITPTFPEWQPGAGTEDVLVKWLGVDSRRKAIMVYSYGGETFVPVSIGKQAERERFGQTIPAGWYAERHQLIDKTELIGSFSDGAPPGDLAWDAEAYDYGAVFTDRVRAHTITNNGVTAVTINSFSVDSEFHSGGMGTAYYELTLSTAPITLQPGESTTVEVTANAVLNESEPTTWREGTLSATTDTISVHKSLYGYFRDPI
jgi:hypothetical protein